MSNLIDPGSEYRRTSHGTNGGMNGPQGARNEGPLASEQRQRYADGWRAGKPTEDPEKLKKWGLISSRPSEFLIHMRGARVLTSSSGQGASCFKWPWDSVAIVPTTVQRLRFTADQVTSEKVGVSVTGLAVYRIADPMIAFRMLNFSFPERASEKLESMLVEMFVGAARRLVANLTVEQCLAKRKEGIAGELMREIAPVVSGSGRPEDKTVKGWGVVIDTIEIQDVRILSQTVFANMQARFRQEQERHAREAELTTQRAIKHGEAEAERQIALARLQAESEVKQRRQQAEEQAKVEALAAEARIADAKLAHERQMAVARMQAEVEKVQLASQAAAARHHSESEAAAARHAAEAQAAASKHATEMAIAAQEYEKVQTHVQMLEARKRAAELEVALAELGTRRLMVEQEPELSKLREVRRIENDLSPAAVQFAVAQQLPQIATAFQQKMGEVHVTAVDGANPFGYVAAAVEGVLGLVRSAGIELPQAQPKTGPLAKQ